MIMKYLVLLIAFATLLACNNKNESKTEEITGQEMMEYNNEIFSKLVDDPEEEGSKMLVGAIEVSDLDTERFGWFNTELEKYTVDQETASQLEEALKGKDLTVFMGTWCEDSQREIPRLVKILVKINNEKGPTIVAVNRDKDIPEGVTKVENIDYVPTIIISENGKEMGRIVESTQESLEKDLLKIALGQDYKHIYEE